MRFLLSSSSISRFASKVLIFMNKNSISLTLFLEKINQIASENPSYRLGGSGTDGTCDCIGLIIGAIRRAGGKWPGLHGSNYTARNEIQDLKTLTDPNVLSVGELVFKHRSPGSAGYSLPGRYSSSPDRNDYYHVGVVLSVRPLRIIHMTAPSVTEDTKLGKWSHHGWCSRIQSAPVPASPSEPLSPIAETLPPEAAARILSALARIEDQLDTIYDVLGGRG